MSDPNPISPLLDGFLMGSPMSDHHGVCCCPAVREHTDQKYIVKIISIPASQVQMDALLLAGAYRDPADAMAYFRQVGEDVMKEAELLKTLSRQAGFDAYDAWQMEPITKRRLGYQVYLVGSYKQSLDKYVRRSPVTHLEAMNMGLDLCEALDQCRQAGSLYVDLKPSNIFVTENKGYHIGDLGFISLDALRYTTLPDKYRSPYTPPELQDPMAAPDLTVDTYAVGMILYQLYNDGQLPSRDTPPEEPMATPVNANYELAEILMRAIDPDPAKRWTEPKELGQALREYMQRNTVNNEPITPYTPLDADFTAAQPAFPDQRPEEDGPAQEQEGQAGEAAAEDGEAQQAPSEEPTAAEEEESPAEEQPPMEDQTLPTDEDGQELLPHQMSDELSRMIAKADDLISHQAPEGVVLPEVPDPPDPFAFAKDDPEEPDDSDVPVEPLMEEPKQRSKPKKTFASQEGKRRTRKFLSTALFVLVLVAIGLGAFWAYSNLYLQTIRGLEIQGDRERITVVIDSDVADELLSVTCSDNYGNVTTLPVTDGQVTFTGLLTNTMYRIELSIEGFHALTGQTSEYYTTDTSTSIVSFNAVTGTEDGTVLLSFTVDGEEPEQWTLFYSAEGEQTQETTFSGHSLTVTDLSIGKVYTFTLYAGERLSLSGETSLEYMASRLILAQNLTVTSNGGSDMTVSWEAPGGVVVDRWSVRCYSDSGYDSQLTVTDTSVLLTGIDPTVSYTVEVTAEGMTQPARTGITANPINITTLTVTEPEDAADELRLNWEYSGQAPSGGWLLMYTIDGSDSQNVVKCDEAAAVISPRVPDAQYEFTLQAADATSIFNNVHVFNTAQAPELSLNGVTAGEITGSLLKTPEGQWRFDTVGQEAITDQFASGEPISIVLHSAASFYLRSQEMDILYVIQDAYGNVLPEYVSQEEGNWREIWYGGDYHYGELDLPAAPTSPGSYSLSVYFDGSFVASMDFTITQ